MLTCSEQACELLNACNAGKTGLTEECGIESNNATG